MDLKTKLILIAVFVGIVGWVLPIEEEIEYINATTIYTSGAADTTGGIHEISEINTGHYVVNESTTPFDVIVNFTNITSFSYVELKAKYFSETSTPSTHIVDVEIFCHVDMEYIDIADLSNHNDSQYFTRAIPDYTHFIQDGNVSIRLDHKSNGNTQHVLHIDTLRLLKGESQH